MKPDLFKSTPHSRWNPLKREWVLVSPQRMQRPWQGKVEVIETEQKPAYDPECYLCPGNVRANGQRNPVYDSTFVFQNDYSALLPGTSENVSDLEGLIVARSERGLCLVGCFSPRHDLSLAHMSTEDIHKVVDMWTIETARLAELPWVTHIQIFENRGALMGTSNPHPHCQIWATEYIPDEPVKECSAYNDYRALHNRCLLCDYVTLERKLGERIVCENEDFVALVPYWAIWPFELLVVSKAHRGDLPELSPVEKQSLAELIRKIGILYNHVFETPFPYSMGFHQQPVNQRVARTFHVHAHYYPPLLRSATVQKFMVGYELLAGPQRDITAEAAAEKLRHSLGQARPKT